jgi:hypothetical protein
LIRLAQKKKIWPCDAIDRSNPDSNDTYDFCDDIWDELESPSGFFYSLPVDFRNGASELLESNLIVDCKLYGWDWSSGTNVTCIEQIKASWDPTYYMCHTLRIPNTPAGSNRVGTLYCIYRVEHVRPDSSSMSGPALGLENPT